MPGEAKSGWPDTARLFALWARVSMNPGQSSAPFAVIVSARASARGEFEHALNCGQTAHALSGVGWQSGNWLLMSRVNLLDPGEFPAF
jgi:hypothetical protein